MDYLDNLLSIFEDEIKREYLQIFQKEGITSMQKLKRLSEFSLKAIGIRKDDAKKLFILLNNDQKTCFFASIANGDARTTKYLLLENKKLGFHFTDFDFSLIAACKTENLNHEIIEELLNSNLNPNIFHHKLANNALEQLCLNEKITLPILRLLVEHKADLYPIYKNKYSNCLATLCRNKNVTIEMINFLLEQNGDLNLKDSEENLPLHCASACESVKEEIVLFLFDRTKQKNVINDDGKTFFHYLIETRDLSIEKINYFVEREVDLSIKSRNGFSVLHFAMRNEKLDKDTIKFLFDKTKSGSLLYYVITNDKLNSSTIKLVLESNPKLKQSLLKYMLGNYVHQLNPDQNTIKILLEKGVSLNDKLDRWASTIFEIALVNSNQTEEFIGYLLEQGGDKIILSKEEILCSLFKNSLASENTEIEIKKINYLMEMTENDCFPSFIKVLSCTHIYNKDVVRIVMKRSSFITNISFESIFFTDYSHKEKREWIHFYLESGKDPNILGKYGDSPFHEYCKFNDYGNFISLDTIALFIEKKADPNLGNGNQETPFYYICKNPSTFPEVLNYLLISNANPNIMSQRYNQKTPFYFACRNMNLDFENFEIMCKAITVNQMETKKIDFTEAFRIICFNEQVDEMKINFFLNIGADLNAEIGGQLKAPFYYICKSESSSIELIKNLIENQKAKPSIGLFGACSSSIPDYNKINYLIEKVFEKFSGKMFSLEIRKVFSNVCKVKDIKLDALKLLIEHKHANFELDSGMQNLIDHNIDRKDIIEYLLIKKVNPNIMLYENGTTLFKYLYIGRDILKTDLIELFLKYGADINLKNFQEQNMLHILLKYGHYFDNNNFYHSASLEKLVFFLEKLPINERDEDLKTCLHYACERIYLPFVEILLTREDIDVHLEDKDFNTPSFYLAEDGAKNYLRGECLKLMKEYEQNGTIWNLKRHKIYPQTFKQKVVTFLICLKRFSFQMKFLLPKPLRLMIIRLSTINNHNIRINNEYKRKLGDVTNPANKKQKN